MKKIFIISLVLISGKLFGQGIESELYQTNYSFIHPAFAGSEGQQISMLARTASYGNSFGDQAETMVLMSYENNFEKIRSGVALTGYSERSGPSSLSSLAISYNYKLTLGTSSELITSVRVQRHSYSVSVDHYRPIEPSDPLLNNKMNLSASNAVADLGVLLKVKESYVGMMANNLVHTNNTIEALGGTDYLGENYAAIIGTSFTISEHLVSEHSLYIPFDDEEYRVDLNNTFTIHDRFLAGLSIENSDDKLFVKGNAGFKVKDYFQILFLVYSGKRNYSFDPQFRGEVFMGFGF